MTTSPFGTPNPFASSEATTSAAAPAPTTSAPLSSRSKRTPLLIGLVGLAAVAAVGSGLYFFSQSGDDASSETDIALPQSPEDAPSPDATPTDTSTPLPTLTQFNGRNPFAAQVVAGGGAPAPASTPVATTAPVSTGSSAFGGGSVAGTAGKDGATGPQGPAGPRGAAGAAGLTPQFATVTLVDGDPVTGAADFTLRSQAGQIDIVDLAVGEPLHVDEPGSWVEYEAMGVDADLDGVLDSVTIQMGDVVYTVALGESVLLWQFTTP